jgi:hypothetical protein
MLFNLNMRRAAVLPCGDSLFVFRTQVGDTPERILLNRIDLSGGYPPSRGRIIRSKA